VKVEQIEWRIEDERDVDERARHNRIVGEGDVDVDVHREVRDGDGHRERPERLVHRTRDHNDRVTDESRVALEMMRIDGNIYSLLEI